MDTNIVYNEDCLVTMKRLPDNSIDMTFTSPPYNRKRNDKYEHYNDTIEDYYGFLVEVTDELLRITKGNVFINIQKNYYNKEEVLRYMGHYSKEICEIFIWEKSNPLPASGNSITNAWEFVLVFGDTLQSNTTYTKNHITTAVNPDTNKLHKAMMNKDVADFFLDKFCEMNYIIYDPFMGSGTTAVCAIEHGCQYIGSEISKDYWDLSQERISNASLKNDNINSIVSW